VSVAVPVRMAVAEVVAVVVAATAATLDGALARVRLLHVTVAVLTVVRSKHSWREHALTNGK